MKKISSIIFLCILSLTSYAQQNTDQLAINVSNAEQQNLKDLQQYIWQRQSKVYVDTALKLTTITQISFNPDGTLNTTIIDASTDVKKKPGLRGKMQEDAAQDKMDYIQKALAISMNYAFMTKGQLVDFFSSAKINENNGVIIATGSNVLVKGDSLTLKIDPKTNLITYREFSSLLGSDAISGKLNYGNFSNGTSHGTTTILNMPVQKMKIEGTNQNYTVRVK